MSIDKIKCEICSKEFKCITYRHLKQHDMTLSEYIEKYPNSSLKSDSSILLKKQSAIRANIERKGIPRSKEVIDKIKQSKKLNPTEAWNKNIPMSEQQKNKLSVIKKHQYCTGKLTHWNIGNVTSDKIKDKIKNTLLLQNLTYSDVSKEKRKITLEKKKNDGWKHHNTLAFIEKLKESRTENAEELFNNKDWLYTKHIIEKKSIANICVLLGLHWRHQSTTVTKKLKEFGIPIHTWTENISAPQKDLENFIRDLKIDIVTNTRKIIPPYELDIYIPEYNLAIEYNGLYWHSEAAGKSQNYHLKKTELCEKNSIRLIHIFEDEWRDQQQKCKDTLTHLFNKSEKGTYARNTIIKEIPWKQAKDFLNKYHLLNAGTCGNYRIGAFDKQDNLIGVMVFGIKNNEGNDKNIELKRFVTDKKNNPGLGSKMFKYAVKEKKYKKVVAFVDRRWFTGLVKSYIGFLMIGISKPTIWWTNGTNRYHRRFVTKKKLIETGADSSLSKKELLRKEKIIRIWDCGKLKLQWVQDQKI